MKHFFQILIVLLIFGFMVMFSAFSANAAFLSPSAPPAVLLDSELPPDLFDDCDGGPSCPGSAFSDMPPVSHWSHLPIDWALTRHIAAGASTSSFRPGAGCTRAQAVTFLWRAAGSPEPQSTECPFEDVSPGAYYRKAVIWAKEQGITSGVSATRFGSAQLCKRAQIITFLWRAKGSPASGVTPGFQDVQANDYYYTAVAWALEHHITSGVSAESFGSGKTCTRAQIVTFLYQAHRS